MTTKNVSSAYVDYYESPLGAIQVCATETHIYAVGFVSEPATRTPNPLTQLAQQQLNEYFAHKRTHFELPVAAQGTPFQSEVWRALARIAYGTTQSYADVAQAVGRPKAVRAVGAANGRNPLGIIIPCHRVIGSDGKLTGFAHGVDKKAWLLRHEGALSI